MNAPLRHGATVVVLPRFDLDQFLDRDRAAPHHTALYVAPPIVLALAKHPAVAEHDLSSLKYVLSAPPRRWTRELAEACARRLGLPPVLQAYGMTELSPGTHVVPLDAADAAARRRSASCSRAPRCGSSSTWRPDEDVGVGRDRRDPASAARR